MLPWPLAGRTDRSGLAVPTNLIINIKLIYYWPQMTTVQKKEKGLNKHSFRGLTPEQINELTQEQVVELFRARMRRRFSRSNHLAIQKSSISTSDSTRNAKSPKRIRNPEKSPCPSRPTSAMPSSSPKWLGTTSQSTTANPSTMWKWSSTWSADILGNFH